MAVDFEHKASTLHPTLHHFNGKVKSAKPVSLGGGVVTAPYDMAFTAEAQ